MATLGPIRAHSRDGSPITLRTFQPSDVESLRAFIAETAATTNSILTCSDEFAARSPDSERERLETLLQDPGALHLGAFDDAGAILGSVVLIAHERRRARHTARLGMLMATHARGRGLGRMTLVAAIDWAREHPFIEKICLEVIDRNEAAVSLYTSLGFQREGLRSGQTRLGLPTDPCRQPNEPVRYVDEILMGLWLCEPGKKASTIDR